MEEMPTSSKPHNIIVMYQYLLKYGKSGGNSRIQFQHQWYSKQKKKKKKININENVQLLISYS